VLFDWVETPPYMTPPSINVCVFKNFMCVCFDNDTHECMLNFMGVCFDNDTHECMLKCFDLELLGMSCVSICIHFEVLVDTLIPP
jgi:hypothetical protein